jgi:hypothetical protein
MGRVGHPFRNPAEGLALAGAAAGRTIGPPPEAEAGPHLKDQGPLPQAATQAFRNLQIPNTPRLSRGLVRMQLFKEGLGEGKAAESQLFGRAWEDLYFWKHSSPQK